jgi:hypothetical protein
VDSGNADCRPEVVLGAPDVITMLSAVSCSQINQAVACCRPHRLVAASAILLVVRIPATCHQMEHRSF